MPRNANEMDSNVVYEWKYTCFPIFWNLRIFDWLLKCWHDLEKWERWTQRTRSNIYIVLYIWLISFWYKSWITFRFNLKAAVMIPDSGVHGSEINVKLAGISNLPNPRLSPWLVSSFRTLSFIFLSLGIHFSASWQLLAMSSKWSLLGTTCNKISNQIRNPDE